jgi:16S rRNA A1518/A1519 N6-dimethyltransferase RsmA/KsgA/DIM1 with predicted DNA glycosylase/AP lyase activity
VESIVLRLRPHAAPPFEVADEALWRKVVDAPFQQRRKQLRNTLPPAVGALGIPRETSLKVLQEMGLLSERPEQVAPATFAELARRLRGAAA